MSRFLSRSIAVLLAASLAAEGPRPEARGPSQNIFDVARASALGPRCCLFTSQALSVPADEFPESPGQSPFSKSAMETDRLAAKQSRTARQKPLSGTVAESRPKSGEPAKLFGMIPNKNHLGMRAQGYEEVGLDGKIRHMLDQRNLMAHTYSRKNFEQAIAGITCRFLPALDQAFEWLKQESKKP